MSFWSKGNGTIRRVDSDNSHSPKQSQNTDSPTQTPVLSGPVRVWTQRHADWIRYDDENAEPSFRYQLINGSADVGDVMIDAHWGYTGRNRRMNFHAWDSVDPDTLLDVDTIEKRLKRNRHYHYGDECTIELCPALKQYFNDCGDFIGQDRNMKFRVEGIADQITNWQFAEMGQ